MVCPNCKHELNPQARVCPTCGTPVPGARVPTVVIAPPGQDGAAPSKKKRRPTAARVFTVLFCLVAMAASCALVAFWFLPSIRVTNDKAAASVTLYSMFDITRKSAPYLTYALIAECIVSVVFCMIPLFKKFADRRQTLVVPKLMCLLNAACYAVPYVVSKVVLQVNAFLKGGTVDHRNPFTAICLGLFLLLWLTSELTIRNRHLVQRRRIEALQDQLNAYGIKPNV